MREQDEPLRRTKPELPAPGDKADMQRRLRYAAFWTPLAEVTSNFDHLRALRTKLYGAGLMSYQHGFIQK
jgi:hypothetical protein